MTWKDDLKRHMIDVLVRLGSPVRDRVDIYGWQQYDWNTTPGTTTATQKREHVARVGIDYTGSEYREADWYEFAGTFVESYHVYGVDLSLVLTDGTKYLWRYDGTLTKLLHAVLED